MLHLIVVEDVERFGGFSKGNICCRCGRRLRVEGSLEEEGFAGR